MRLPAFLARRPWAPPTAAVAVVALAGAVYWFAPQNLVLDRTVNEQLPSVAPATSDPQSTANPPIPTPSRQRDRVQTAPSATPAVTEPRTLAQGIFRSLEHSTSGAALIVELADGARFLRLSNLDTSNGPDLRVILSDRAPSNGWYGYADGHHLDLGGLKGNIGSSNYAIPTGTDLSRFRSAVIWCRRFAVGFGVAPVAVSG